MAYKIYTKSNYFYIVDTETDKIYEALAKDVRVRKEFVDSTDFYFDNVNGFESKNKIAFANIQDESGVAYSDIATFITFYEANTGNFNLAEASAQNTFLLFEIADGEVVVSNLGSGTLIPDATIFEGKLYLTNFGNDFTKGILTFTQNIYNTITQTGLIFDINYFDGEMLISHYESSILIDLSTSSQQFQIGFIMY